MLATSLGLRLPQVDPVYVSDMNAVERAMVLDHEGELSMPRIFTHPSEDVRPRCRTSSPRHTAGTSAETEKTKEVSRLLPMELPLIRYCKEELLVWPLALSCSIGAARDHHTPTVKG